MFFLSNKNWKILSPLYSIVNEKNNLDLINLIFEKHPIKAIFLIDKTNRLEAVLSKGDFLKSHEKLNWNYAPFYLQSGNRITDSINDKINRYNSIPILNEQKEIIKIIETSDNKGIEVNNILFKPYIKPLIIAEIGNNHNGCLENAKRLIDEAKLAGVNAVKFQARSLEHLYINLSDDYLNSTDFSTSYTINQLKKFNLSFDQLSELFLYAKNKNLIIICTPFDVISANFLKTQNIDLIKIASADMSNYKLLSEFIDSYIPLIISTGMHKLESINSLSVWLRNNYIESTFLHVNSTYPTPYSDVNLRFMPTLEKLSTSGLYGYSGHERGIHIPLAAVSMGASVIEKHFTLDKSLEGNDHKVSLLPSEMKMMVDNINSLIMALSGGINKKSISQGEKLNKIALSKGVYIKKDKLKGTTLEVTDIKYFSPCVGLTPEEIQFYVGKTLTRDLKKNDPIDKSCFELNKTAKNFSKISNYGIPVRFRDLNDIQEEFNPYFLEYHMFSTDLNIDPRKFKGILKGKNMSIHAPEQFEDGFVLDLVSNETKIHKKSLMLFHEIISWAEDVKNLTGQDKINLITNVGGATNNLNEISNFNKKIAFEKLSEINEMCIKKGIQLLPQTMPPFPWHFGGQGFHRLFVDPKDMIESQKWADFRFCMDFSHTYMSCCHLNISFYDAIDEVSPYFDYIHVADSIYPGEEGINIGEGEIEFKRLKKFFNSINYNWIPEVWNGHLDNFNGFKEALIKLNNL